MVLPGTRCVTSDPSASLPFAVILTLDIIVTGASFRRSEEARRVVGVIEHLLHRIPSTGE